MDEMEFGNRLPIDGYGPGFFRIGGQVYRGPTLIAPDGIRGWKDQPDVLDVIAFANEIEVFLVGTGAEIAPLSESDSVALRDAGIPFEFMSTPSACRTFNVLLSQEKAVSAALLPI